MITLAEVQDQCAKLRAEGKTPQTILLSFEDANQLGDPEFLYGLRCHRANNYPESVVVQGIYEVIKLKKYEYKGDNNADSNTTNSTIIDSSRGN